MRAIIVLAALLSGCNVDRPQVIDAGGNDEAITLPGGGVLLLRRALQQQDQPRLCYVRARFTGVFVPMDCDEARLVNVR
jgi:hypothetical protein